jgi:hypothetical protein
MEKEDCNKDRDIWGWKFTAQDHYDAVELRDAMFRT